MTAVTAPVGYRFGLFELQPDERRLYANGAEVRLGGHAFDLLVALVERDGHLVTKNELLGLVWGKVIVEENTLQSHISDLRRALGSQAITTVSGRGYRFALDVTRSSATASAASPKHTLPHALTSFIGRETEMVAYESARLFIERARLQLPHFAITTQNSPAIASICRRLDGIALALELAAPRLRTISVEEVSRGLDRRFEPLTEGSRTALPRHRTLRALINWSYDLLSDAEKAVLRSVSVFAGGRTLEAVEHLSGVDPPDDSGMLDLLTSLAEKNLIAAETRDGATRYWRGIALSWQSLGLVAHSQNDYRSARNCYEQALALLRDQDDRVGVSVVLCDLGQLAYSEGHYDEAGVRLTEGVALARALGDWRLPIVLTALGMVTQSQGNSERARSLCEEALASARKMGDRAGTAYALTSLAEVAHDCSDSSGAQSLLREALAIQRDLGNPQGIADALGLFGGVAVALGGSIAAARIWGQAQRLCEEFGWEVEPARRAYRARDIAAARAALGEETFEVAWNGGRAMTLDQAVEFALNVGHANPTENGER